MANSIYKRRFYIDVCIAVLIGFVLSVFFFSIDAVDRWYAFTRPYEAWELDEFAGIVIALMVAMTYFSVCSAITFLRLNKALEKANMVIADQANMQSHQEKLMSLGQLSGGMAHEINNALQPMLGITQVARRRLKDKDEELYHALGVIEEGANHAAHIVTSVLEFSKHNQHDQMKEQHAGALIKRSIDFAQTLLPSGVSVRYPDDHSPERLNESIYADETNMKQVFINLFKNADEAMQSKGEILIDCRCMQPEDKVLKDNDLKSGHYLVICVSDNGTGIAEGMQQKIFDPFFTTKEPYTSTASQNGGQSGSGLGLSTVYGLMRLHGGAIAVKNNDDKGACFTLYLPVI